MGEKATNVKFSRLFLTLRYKFAKPLNFTLGTSAGMENISAAADFSIT
ncbi:hypothetical protein [Parasphingorhabdus sp.]